MPFLCGLSRRVHCGFILPTFCCRQLSYLGRGHGTSQWVLTQPRTSFKRAGFITSGETGVCWGQQRRGSCGVCLRRFMVMFVYSGWESACLTPVLFDLLVVILEMEIWLGHMHIYNSNSWPHDFLYLFCVSHVYNPIMSQIKKSFRVTSLDKKRFFLDILSF